MRISSKKNLKEVEFLFYLARTRLDNYNYRQILKLFGRPIDWNYIVEESIYQRVAGLIYHNLKGVGLKQRVPPAIFSKLKDYYEQTANENHQFWEEFCRIQEALRRAKIEIIPLKGIILVHILYGDMGLRPMRDIDILVKEEDAHKAEEAAFQLGYDKITKTTENYYQGHHCDVTLNIKKSAPEVSITLDIHWNFAISRPNKIDITDAWDRVEKRVIDGREIFLLSPEDMFFSLCLHLRRHIRFLLLKHICDISELLVLHKDSLDWNYIVKKAEKDSIRTTLYFALFSAKELLGSDVPEAILNGLKPGLFKRKLINRFINKKTFLNRKLRYFSFKNYWRVGIFLQFLMLDSIKDFFIYALFVPIEEFSKFFSLPLESKRTLFFYRIRFVYMPLRIVAHIFSALINILLKFLRI